MVAINGSTQQIVTAYEDCGLEPTKIVEAFDGEFELTAVIATLLQFSGKYREAQKEAGKSAEVQGFKDEHEEAAIRTITQLMEYAEDENLRGRLAMFVRDDRRGRRDAVSKLAASGGTNIMQFQLFLTKANEALKLTEQKAVDIKSEVKVA